MENYPDSRKNSKTAIIIGAGISGLSSAYELLKLCPNLQVRILESSWQPGGVIKGITQDNLLVECGPESFSTLKGDVLDLCSELKISQHIIQTRPNNRRSFVSLGHKLHPLPEGLMVFAPSNMMSFAFTDIFSIYGKLRMSMDLLLPRSKGLADESLSQFVSRRLGDEALRTLAEPMIGGIYGGDPDLLSASATVPQLVEMERLHGSIIKGLIKARRKQTNAKGSSGPRYGALASFDRGITFLVESILEKLPAGTLLLKKTAKHIIKGRSGSGWTVLCDDNSHFDADYLILATPALRTAGLLTEVNPRLASRLKKIQRSSAIIVNLVYDRSKIRRALDGFGFVVPRKEGMLISACSFSSIKFDGRAPDDKLLLRLFTGGLLKMQAMEMTDLELLERCHQELKEILFIDAAPLSHFVTRHTEAIPQYMVGHAQLLQEIRTELSSSPGIELAGNSYIGVGLPDCIKSAKLAAARIFSQIISNEEAAS